MRVVLMIITAMLASTTHAQEHREAGAHEHGSGMLDIAIQGQRLTIALSVPAFDLVGFEHAPETRAQKLAVKRARARLQEPDRLWGFPAAASCSTDAIETSLLEPHHEHDDHASHDGHHEHKHDTHGEDAAHSNVTVNLDMRCEDMEALTVLEPEYFDIFPNAQELQVRVLGPSGASLFEIERGNALIILH
ncbi:DUF2796 domain-containing protein [Nitratireductor basaltis]|uniref:DUF2796 domain-containing protein n=1 Tax=Nitratireductor basaltis TaxID=472175 RepID=A0A084U546_9HYPH|nr:DUF2796 domain-containing protein [Nitratireductor basaltis]KFB08082.1 hypothetical protein EL18_03292 [Nitratireductor basaltis]